MSFFWTIYSNLRHPFYSYSVWSKWRNRPRIGDEVVDCRGRKLRVVWFGDTDDDLVLDDGYHVSWIHCCDYPEKK